jgi:bifunctional UDP-N-acetylglucosamine pyrophosphorylase / glucosamine-1-phosphate N-acetyltransferase
MKTTALLLAAGEGKRMKSARPKVLHRVCGKSLLQHVLTAAAGLSQRQVIVVGHGREEVMEEMGPGCVYVVQEEQLGTGHAVKMAAAYLDCPEILVLCGDTPLLDRDVLAALLTAHRQEGSLGTVLTARVPRPAGYGRILRDEGGRVLKIVEERDATAGEKRIREINTGTYCFHGPSLARALDRLSADNAQREYYLTDVLEILGRGGKTAAWTLADYRRALGVNSREELAAAARIMRETINRHLMASGVTLVDPHTTYVDAGVLIQEDTVIYPNTCIEGNSRVGKGCLVGPGARLCDAVLEDGVVLRESVVTGATVKQGLRVGPFACIGEDGQIHYTERAGGTHPGPAGGDSGCTTAEKS